MTVRRVLLKGGRSLRAVAPVANRRTWRPCPRQRSSRGESLRLASRRARRNPGKPGLVDTPWQAVLAKGGDIAGLRGVVVVRRGALAAERYFAGAQQADLRPIHSATKSVASILVGQALAQGKIKDLTQTVAALLPPDLVRPDAPAAAITLGQILTGTTGLAYGLHDPVP